MYVLAFVMYTDNNLGVFRTTANDWLDNRQAHACTHTSVLRPYGLCLGLPGWAGTRTNLDFTV